MDALVLYFGEDPARCPYEQGNHQKNWNVDDFDYICAPYVTNMLIFNDVMIWFSVISTLLTFVRMFNQAHDENEKQVEAEKKAAQKESQLEKLKQHNHPKQESESTKNTNTKNINTKNTNNQSESAK